MQVRKTAEAALEAIDAGMCVVIGLQSTGEANTTATRDECGDTLDDFVSGACVDCQLLCCPCLSSREDSCVQTTRQSFQEYCRRPSFCAAACTCFLAWSGTIGCSAWVLTMRRYSRDLMCINQRPCSVLK